MQYNTVESEQVKEFVERRSRFIGSIKPVKDEDSALDFIEGVRSHHPRAKHNVYAYCLREGNIKRYSDDGEPQGTAGGPVLQIILKNQIVDVAIVVTRYFGGILLGKGGLVRAYSQAANLALQSANMITMCWCDTIRLSCDYSCYGQLSPFFCRDKVYVSDTKFLSSVEINLHIPVDHTESFVQQIKQITSGKVQISFLGKSFQRKLEL